MKEEKDRRRWVDGGRCALLCMRPENDPLAHLSATTSNLLQSLVIFVPFSVAANARVGMYTHPH